MLQAWRAAQFKASLHKRLAAMATIERYLPALRARLAFLKLRRAAVVLQQHWRAHLAGREAAALRIQSAVRMWLVRRQYKQTLRRVALVQVSGWYADCSLWLSRVGSLPENCFCLYPHHIYSCGAEGLLQVFREYPCCTLASSVSMTLHAKEEET